jgi:hypothetical protein
MHLQRGSRRLSWAGWICQCALLCVLALHSAGLLHKHDAQAGDPDCAACQVVNHQAALDLPEVGLGGLLPILLLLFLVLPWHRGVIPGVAPFARPRSRAPPAPLPSAS